MRGFYTYLDFSDFVGLRFDVTVMMYDPNASHQLCVCLYMCACVCVCVCVCVEMVSAQCTRVQRAVGSNPTQGSSF